MLRIKELEVTCCQAWEKCGSLAALLGALLLSGGLGLLTLTFALPTASGAAFLT